MEEEVDSARNNGLYNIFQDENDISIREQEDILLQEAEDKTWWGNDEYQCLDENVQENNLSREIYFLKFKLMNESLDEDGLDLLAIRFPDATIAELIDLQFNNVCKMFSSPPSPPSNTNATRKAVQSPSNSIPSNGNTSFDDDDSYHIQPPASSNSLSTSTENVTYEDDDPPPPSSFMSKHHPTTKRLNTTSPTKNPSVSASSTPTFAHGQCSDSILKFTTTIGGDEGANYCSWVSHGSTTEVISAPTSAPTSIPTSAPTTSVPSPSPTFASANPSSTPSAEPSSEPSTDPSTKSPTPKYPYSSNENTNTNFDNGNQPSCNF